jgi:hypothetical protein
MRLSRTLLASTVIAALGGLPFGFDTAVISGTTDDLDIKDQWKGDLAQGYTKRYSRRFPGETEAKGLPAEENCSDGWGKK